MVNVARKRRQARVRGKISGTSERPRLNVFRSLKHIYAQIIDDVEKKTIVAASSLDEEFKGKYCGNKEMAFAVGEALAKKAKKAGVEVVVFDRAGYIFHGRVESLAEGAKKGGLIF